MSILSIAILLMAPAAEPFTAETAVRLATANHPALQAAGYAVEEAQGEAQQAGLLPNPELDVGVEGWKGSNDEEGHEFLVGVSQTLPISGSRRLARKAGMLGADAADAEAEALWLEISGKVKALFYETFAAQERLKIQEDICADADALAALTRVRFEKGDIPEIDLMRAVAEQQRYQAAREHTCKELEGLRRRLAEVCSLTIEDLPDCVADTIPVCGQLPDYETLKTSILEHPRNSARLLRVEQAVAMLESIRRSALVEPTIRVGMRRESASGDNALDLEVSIPLPLFDRNQGAIAAARAKKQRIHAENEAAVRETLRTCMALRAEAEALLVETGNLREQVMPQFEAVQTALEKALDLGGATLFETLAAKRDVAETQLTLLENEYQIRIALISLEVLLGKVG